MDWLQLIATIVQAGALIFLIMQVRIMHLEWQRAHKANLALHERTKKQSTLEHAGELWAEARYELESKFGSEVIATDEAENIFQNKELKANVDKLLGTLEHIAAGVNSEIYDGDILYRMCATSVINNFHKFKNYIRIRRQQESEEMYIELEALVIKFMERRSKKPMKLGDIINS